MSKYTIGKRFAVLRSVVEHDLSFRDAAAVHGVSKNSVRSWTQAHYRGTLTLRMLHSQTKTLGEKRPPLDSRRRRSEMAKKKAQHQGSLIDQLAELVTYANKEGLYDAADYLQPIVERSRGPVTVVNHEHYFSHPDSEIDGRFDAIEDSLGEFYVQDVKQRQLYRCKSWKAACAKAKKMAEEWTG